MEKKKITICLMCVVAGLSYMVFSAAEQPAKNTDKTEVRVGVFDSRALAVAHFGKIVRDGVLEELYAEHDKAKADGDEQRMKELEIKGQLLQKKFHMQAFGTAPIDDILEEIKEDIPGVAKTAGVDVIVCRHDIVYQDSATELVDVTNRMVQFFEPDEETLEKIDSLLKKPPVLQEILENMDHSHQ